MYCSSCGAHNPEDRDYCGACGAGLSSENQTSLGTRVQSPIPRRLRPMGVGDMLDETIRLYRQNLRTFVGIVAVLQVPLIILQAIQLAFVGTSFTDLTRMAERGQFQMETFTSQLGMIIFFVVSTLAIGLLAFVFFIFTEAALSSAISERYLDRQIGVRRAYGVALSCFWRILLNLMVVITLLLLLLIAFPGVALVVVAITGSQWILILGIVLTLFVGIPLVGFLSIRWGLVVPAIVLERKGPLSALSRSSGLVKGSWWRVLGIFIVAAIIQYLVAAIPSGLLAMAVSGVGALLSPTQSVISTIVNTVLGSVFGIIAAPLMPTITVLLYYDLRMRKEGFDIQLEAERLDAGQRASEGQG